MVGMRSWMASQSTTRKIRHFFSFVNNRHFTDKTLTQSHSFPLADSLAPVVSFQNVKRTYLGRPFTDCVVTRSTNVYTEKMAKEPYKKIDCVMRVLMESIARECDCYIGYITDIDRFLPNSTLNTLNTCNFTTHGHCCAPIIERFQWQDKQCLPACSSYSFHQENIQYVKISDNYIKTARPYSTADHADHVKITRLVISLAEQTNKEYKEVPDYPFDQFLAEVGGTAGLFLGLSVLTVVKFLATLASMAIMTLFSEVREVTQLKKKKTKLHDKGTSTIGNGIQFFMLTLSLRFRYQISHYVRTN